MTDRRDFHPARAPQGARWPNGAGLAVSIVVNIEEGAERSIGDGDEVNEHIYEAVERVDDVFDPCMESHFAYGPRAGWPRIRAVLADHGVRATLNACGRAVARTPWIIKEAVADGHEISAHGWRWERHTGMSRDHETAVIAQTVRTIADVAGSPPRGWHTRSATTAYTRDILREHGGFLYDSNAYDDDMPYFDQGHVVLPYAFDTNDMRFYNGGGFVFGDDFSRYCKAAFDRLLAESRHEIRMLSIGLHTRIIGRPARIDGLVDFLTHACAQQGVWFARRDQIAHHWRALHGLPQWTPTSERTCDHDT